jgi:hypothetical protein
VYGGFGGSSCRPLRTHERGAQGKGASMSWTTPAFEEIKMDAEAKSYVDGLG